jgi:excisionase family DNA binding protein
MRHSHLNDDNLDLYDPTGVGTVLSLSRSQVYNLLRDKRLESVKIGKSRRVTRSQLRAFIERAERGEFEVS